MTTKAANLKTLDVLGQTAYYVATPEGNFVLIRPLCDLLGVHADKQIERIKEDEILADEHAVQRVHLPGDDRHRSWSSLPEEYIYGWLFGIKMTNTMSDATKQNLIGYKRACYHALFQHFHGRIKQAQQAISRKAANEAEIIHLRRQQQEATPDLTARIDFLLAENKQIGNPLVRIQKNQFELDLSTALSEEQ